MSERPELLQERQKMHGSFEKNAEISQELKWVFKKYGSDRLLLVHRESLDMIAFKLSRILSGQAQFSDHWKDIAGYAELGAEVCEK